MSEADAAAPGSIFRLIYRSHSLIDEAERKTVLGEIFTTARRKNKALDVTGALITSGDTFVQALEGEESVVRDLYATIARDSRHDGVSLVEEGHVDGRTFGRWAMAKVDEDGGADIRLMSNAKKGVIVASPRQDISVTPEQEAVLGFMRETIVLETS